MLAWAPLGLAWLLERGHGDPPASASSFLFQETRTSSESIISVPASSTSGSPSRVIYVSGASVPVGGVAGLGSLRVPWGHRVHGELSPMGSRGVVGPLLSASVLPYLET